MRKYRWTTVGVIAATVMLVTALGFDLDYFETFTIWVGNFESFELDEFIFPLLIILVFFSFDLIVQRKEQNIQAQKEAIYKATIQASDHVLKNCLNQMQIIKYAAEETPNFDPEVLQTFDHIMNQAVSQLDALGQVKEIDKESIGKSVNIKIYD